MSNQQIKKFEEPTRLNMEGIGILSAHPEPRGWKGGRHRFWNIFVSGSGKQRTFYEAMEFIFWRTLCPMPDQTRIGMWWYGKSGRIASYFHRRHCNQCKGRKP